jgi:hypothetical protein
MRDHKAVWVGLSLCLLVLAACGDDSSEQPEPSPDPDPDAGDPMECEAKPLSAFCTDEQDCPSSFDDGLESWCSSTSVSTMVQQNSCGGRSLLAVAGLGATTYHFDDEDALIGVHATSDLVLACSDAAGAPSSAEQTYGRECTLSGSASNPCQVGCPDIDCISGAFFDADWPFDFEQASEIPITACRNDECFTGMLAADANPPSPSSGVGFSVPEEEVVDRDQTGRAEISFWGVSGGGVFLKVQWWAWSDADLLDGDHYRVTADAPGGTRVLIDREVDYGMTNLGSGACALSCKFIETDVRGTSDLDGGIDEDAGQ